MHSLETPIEDIVPLTPRERELFGKAGFKTVRDVLYFFPKYYEDFSSSKRIIELEAGTRAAVEGTIITIGIKTAFGKRRTSVTEAHLEDSSGDRIRIIWMYKPGVAKNIPQGTNVRISGKIKETKKGKLYIVNPAYEHVGIQEPVLFEGKPKPRAPLPVYAAIRGISSETLKDAIDRLLSIASEIPDPIPPAILKTYNLYSFKKAVAYIHHPPDITRADAARKRFAFEEIFFIQLDRAQTRTALEKESAFGIPYNPGIVEEIESRLAFPLTAAQKRAARQILKDISKPHPMARLLEGDVGSGKTLVAVIAALAAVRAGFQVAYMAPTEILARQHFEAFFRELAPFRTSVGLLTSAECKVFPSKLNPREPTHIARSQLLDWIRDSKMNIVVGTHALLQKQVQFKKLALVVVDEQHRFGVNQRKALVRGATASIPHLLSMTATPIPRTLALTVYGDLDLSLLDELPAGRKRPITRIVPPEQRAEAYQFVEKNIEAGGQAFVICPKIDETKTAKKQSTEIKTVTAEYKKLRGEIFPNFAVAMLHGKLKPKEKEEIIKKFRNKHTHILVSTSVIEVGMDIPNASVMMIEGAERFGLASLHQFRGRVGRAGQQAYCLVFTESKAEKTKARLEALANAKNGFELAEYDLQFRGPGELSGSSQWGVSDIGMEALKNIKMVEAARKEAQKIIDQDPELSTHPLLRKKISSTQLHLE